MAEVTPITNECEKIIFLQQMAQSNPIQLQRFIRKSSNIQVISVVCECLLNVVKGNVPVSIPNFNNFEEAYKILINRKTSLEKKSAVILSTLKSIKKPEGLLQTVKENGQRKKPNEKKAQKKKTLNFT